MPPKIDVDPTILEKDLKDYPIKEVATKYGCHTGTISSWARKYNIKYIIKRGHNDVNHFFFDQWSASMAYILGFITADGNVHGSRPYINVEIKRDDVEILKFILDNVYPSGNIYYYKHYNKKTGAVTLAAKISIYSNYIKEKLKEYSIMPNKTGKHRIDFNIPEEFKWDYIRGFLDGDGSIFYCRGYLHVTFVAQSIEFLEDLKELIGIHANINTSSNPAQLRYYSNGSSYIINHIYDNECFALQRKKIIAFKDNK